MLYIYLVVSAVLTVFLNNFWDIFRESYSWWLVPVLFLAFFVGFLLLQFAALFIMILTTNLNKPPKGTKFFKFLLKESLPIIIKLALVKINAEGVEKLPEDGRMLFVCNHRHDFDPVILLTVFKNVELSFLGKKEIWTEKPIIARVMHLIRSLPIDRENDREAAKTIIQAIRLIKDDISSVAVFPEGYTNFTEDELLPFRNGCLKIAMKTSVPIVVCAMTDTELLGKRIFRRRSKVDMCLVDVISPEVYEGMNTTELGDLIREKMLNKLTEMRNK